MKYILLLLIFSCINLKNKDIQGYIEYKIKLPKKEYKIGEKIVVEHSLINHFSKPIFFFSYSPIITIFSKSDGIVIRSGRITNAMRYIGEIKELSQYKVSYQLAPDISKLRKGKYELRSGCEFSFTEEEKNMKGWGKEKFFYPKRLRSNMVEFEVTEEIYKPPYPWDKKDIEGNYIYMEEIEKLYSEAVEHESIYQELQRLKKSYKDKKEYYKKASKAIKEYRGETHLDREEPYPWDKNTYGDYVYIEKIKSLYSKKGHEEIYKKLEELKRKYHEDRGRYYKSASDAIKAYKLREWRR